MFQDLYEFREFHRRRHRTIPTPVHGWYGKGVVYSSSASLQEAVWSYSIYLDGGRRTIELLVMRE